MEEAVRFQGRKKRDQQQVNHDHTNQEMRGDSLVAPKPLPNPVLESKERKELHRELLWNQRIGHQVLNTKTELQRCLQERRLQKNKMKMEGEGEDTPLPEFMQVHKRITSGNQSS